MQESESQLKDNIQLLLIYDSPLLPINSGDRQRVYRLVSHLSQFMHIHLLLTGDVNVFRVQQIFNNRVLVIPYAKSSIRFFFRKIKNILQRCPLLLRYINHVEKTFSYWSRYPKDLDIFVEHYCRENEISFVIVEYLWMAPAVQRLPSTVKKIIDTHDIQSERFLIHKNNGQIYPFEITQKQEIQLLSAFDCILAIQKREAEHFQRWLPLKKVLHVGLSLPVVEYSNVVSDSAVVTVLFVGTNTSANIEGLRTFLDNIWPDVLGNSPVRVNFNIAGNVCHAFKNEYPNVNWLGFVAELEELYHSADIVVNPVWYGTGLKIKTVEAISYKKALITTAIGVEGMSEPHGACLVVESVTVFRRVLINLISDATLRECWSQKAAQYCQNFLSGEFVYKELMEYLGVSADCETM